MPNIQCCCDWGAAVKGEFPEFSCHQCPIHDGEFETPEELCKRHANA